MKLARHGAPEPLSDLGGKTLSDEATRRLGKQGQRILVWDE